jgi:ribonuclease HI
MLGPQVDTSNNEMELMAIVETSVYSVILIESDSRLCIDTLTTYAKRWYKNGWRKPDGKPVA